MATNNRSTNSPRHIAGTVLIALGGLVLLASAAAKFARVPQVAAQLGAFGFEGNKLTLIAIAEVLSALLFLIPRTRSAGLLLVSAFLGGAIATHVQHDQVRAAARRCPGAPVARRLAPTSGDAVERWSAVTRQTRSSHAGNAALTRGEHNSG